MHMRQWGGGAGCGCPSTKNKQTKSKKQNTILDLKIKEINTIQIQMV